MTGWRDANGSGSLSTTRERAAPGFIRREQVLDKLRGSSNAPLVLVVAGAGYGKTTAVSQWLQEDHRSAAWLTASVEHNDPVVILADIVRVLDKFEPLEPRAKHRLSAVSIDFSSVLVPRLEEAVSTRGRPFVLVIDDAHRLRRQIIWTLIDALVNAVPAGSQVVLISRTEPALALSRMRADRRVQRVTSDHLALDQRETEALFSDSELALPADVVNELWQRTEGWPVALYLAMLALQEATADDRMETVARFAGDDRLIVEYVREELLEVLPHRMRTFLLSASILEELDAGACDAVLERHDSAEMLEDAARSLSLVIPVDRTNTCFRMHQLLRDSLRSVLARRDPELVVRLHERAARWYETVGNVERAVEHQLLTHDQDGIDDIIWRAAPIFTSSGRTATVNRWLDTVPDQEVARRPALAVIRGWCALTDGDMPSLGYWASVVSNLGDDLTLPDGNAATAAAALLRAVEGSGGVDRTRENAALAYELDRVGSPFRAVARYIEGSALRVQGHRDEALQKLHEAEALSVPLPATYALCVAQRAALALEEDDFDDADSLVDQYSALIDQYGIGERPAQATGFAVTAFVRARNGKASEARTAAKQASFLISMMTTVGPWRSVDAEIFLARAVLLLGDVGLARALVHDAQHQLSLVPDRYLLEPRLAEIATTTDAETLPLGVLAAPMTPAELRVLRYLPTHLTFAAIAEELFVSRNTVKTQAIALYRKLGASTRDGAVQAAQGLGLLEH